MPEAYYYCTSFDAVVVETRSPKLLLLFSLLLLLHKGYCCTYCEQQRTALLL